MRPRREPTAPEVAIQGDLDEINRRLDTYKAQQTEITNRIKGLSSTVSTAKTALTEAQAKKNAIFAELKEANAAKASALTALKTIDNKRKAAIAEATKVADACEIKVRKRTFDGPDEKEGAEDEDTASLDKKVKELEWQQQTSSLSAKEDRELIASIEKLRSRRMDIGKFHTEKRKVWDLQADITAAKTKLNEANAKVDEIRSRLGPAIKVVDAARAELDSTTGSKKKGDDSAEAAAPAAKVAKYTAPSEAPEVAEKLAHLTKIPAPLPTFEVESAPYSALAKRRATVSKRIDVLYKCVNERRKELSTVRNAAIAEERKAHAEEAKARKEAHARARAEAAGAKRAELEASAKVNPLADDVLTCDALVHYLAARVGDASLAKGVAEPDRSLLTLTAPVAAPKAETEGEEEAEPTVDPNARAVHLVEATKAAIAAASLPAAPTVRAVDDDIPDALRAALAAKAEREAASKKGKGGKRARKPKVAAAATAGVSSIASTDMQHTLGVQAAFSAVEVKAPTTDEEARRTVKALAARRAILENKGKALMAKKAKELHRLLNPAEEPKAKEGAKEKKGDGKKGGKAQQQASTSSSSKRQQQEAPIDLGPTPVSVYATMAVPSVQDLANEGFYC
jgi:uncharacterized coiled-coil DUF342 family protein